MHHRTLITWIVGAGWLFASLAFLWADDVTNTPPALAGKLATLTVRVTGFQNDQGIAQISLFQDAKGFPDQVALAFRTNATVITNNQVLVAFTDIPFGDYAVSVLHDENRNGRMEVNWLGMPREGHGVSNDARGKAGPPAFVAARFKLETPTRSLRINLTY